eukprot:3690518-Pyramimonas_sp.AAC.1
MLRCPMGPVRGQNCSLHGHLLMPGRLVHRRAAPPTRATLARSTRQARNTQRRGAGPRDIMQHH